MNVLKQKRILKIKLELSSMDIQPILAIMMTPMKRLVNIK